MKLKAKVTPMPLTGLFFRGTVLICAGLFVLNNVTAVSWAQQADDEAATTSATDETNSSEQENQTPATVDDKLAAQGTLAEKWDRLIYVPFRELQKVLDNQHASVVVPYAEYMDLVQKYLESQQTRNGWSPDAVITSSSYAAIVEEDIVRINATFHLNVMKEKGWATIPLTFGSVATGKLLPDDGSVILKGVSQGRYDLLVQGKGTKTISLELLATVRTSPEDNSFSMQCPPTGICTLQATVPEADQSVQVSPVQVLLPVEQQPEGQTQIRCSLGAVDQFEVRWNPRAGTKPVMDLLAGATTQSTTRIETGLLQTKTTIDYEILRGELRDVSVSVPPDARIIDVVSPSGRIKTWTVKAVSQSHQQLLIELLSPVSDRLQIEVQTERNPEGDIIQLLGKSENGLLQGVHAENVVREAGRLIVSTDPSLTTVVKAQSGVKRVDVSTPKNLPDSTTETDQAWEFSGTTGQLILQVRPVEPRLLVDQATRLVFDDAELRLQSQLIYTVERAGVFQLHLKFPESLTIDTVRADGMSEFNVDKDAGQLTLSLNQKRVGDITVDITAHSAFNATTENLETELPTVTPVGVERETGRITVYAPQFVDVMTVEEKLIGLFHTSNNDAASIGRAVRVSSWNYTRRPIALFMRTTPRPAQLAATVGTTVRIEPEIVKLNSVLSFDIQNAGLDTLRIAVPEANSGNVRFQAISSGHVIQQRNRSDQAEDGWVTWTLVLQSETTGNVQIRVDWEQKTGGDETASSGSPEQSITIDPPRVLAPFGTEQNERRKVTLTQVRGELRLLRHESLSISADEQSDTVEAIDVRELQLIEADGYLAYRYFSQPASATIRVRKHNIHEVVATVISRSVLEIVAEKQSMAAFRCRYRIVSSERQRLRIDLPAECDLQAPTINGQRTTIERATDVTAAENMEAYYINVSREETSDSSFLLTVQFRSRIVAEGEIPFAKRGSKQLIKLPTIGEDDGATVVQQTMLAIWAPKDISFIGDPDHWTQFGRSRQTLFRPFDSPDSAFSANYLNEWVNDSFNGSTDFATQGHVSLYRAVGAQPDIVFTWWNRPFLFWMISGTLVAAGLILRRTPWENRITIILLAAFFVSMWWLKDGYSALQFMSAAWPGMCVAGAIWLTSLILAHRDQSKADPPENGSGGTQNSLPNSPPPEDQPSTSAAGGNGPEAETAQALPPLVRIRKPQTNEPSSAVNSIVVSPVVSPSPEVTDIMNKLMGGK